MAEWIWTVTVGLAALALSLLLLVSPERLARWREYLWESDSDGEVPAREDKEDTMSTKGGKHDGPQASTQDSVKPSGSAGRPYQSGKNVGSGSGPKPSKPAPVSGPTTGSAG